MDLLSGALAAVIILFIIVPKMSTEQQETLEEMDRLNVQVSELANLLEAARNSVPEEVFQQIVRRMDELQNTVRELSSQVQNLQSQLASTQRENEQLRQQNQSLQQTNEQQAQRIRDLENQVAQSQRAGDRNQGGGRVFGVNADLGVVIVWPENIDVDLYVKNMASGEICCYQNKQTTFGNLNEDITSRTEPDDDRYELFYQTRVIPGQYQIYVNIFARAQWNGEPAHVEGYVIMYPGLSNQKKIEFPNITLTRQGQDVVIGTLIVTENNIQLQ